MSAKTLYRPVQKRSSSELIDVLDSSETSAAGKWSSMSLLHFKSYEICDAQILRQGDSLVNVVRNPSSSRCYLHPFSVYNQAWKTLAQSNSI